MSQQRARAVTVTDSDGLRGTVDAASPELNSGLGQVLVYLENGQQAFVPSGVLMLQNDGSFALPFSFNELTQAPAGAHQQQQQTQQRGASFPYAEQHQQQQPRGVGAGRDEEETVVVPVIAEHLDVQKRKVDAGGVRIRKIVHEREEIIDQPLIREEVQVKRVPVNRVVEGPIPVRHVGNTMIVSLLEEVLVVEKRLMLKEELHITKGEVETYKPQRITLRTEEAMVERVENAEGQQRGGVGAAGGDGSGGSRGGMENPPR